MRRRVFLDTNVLVYAYSLDARAERARNLLGEGGVVGAQGLNEFASVARRKLAMSWAEVRSALNAITLVCPEIEPLTAETQSRAVDLAEKHGFSIFDSSMLAAALSANCTAFLSEDLHDGMLIEGRLRIEDPFRATRV